MLPVANGRCTAVSWDLPRSVSSNRPRILASTLLSWEKKKNSLALSLFSCRSTFGCPCCRCWTSSGTDHLIHDGCFDDHFGFYKHSSLFTAFMLVATLFACTSPLRSVSGKSCGIACFCRYREICSMTLWWMVMKATKCCPLFIFKLTRVVWSPFKCHFFHVKLWEPKISLHVLLFMRVHSHIFRCNQQSSLCGLSRKTLTPELMTPLTDIVGADCSRERSLVHIHV